MPWEELLKQGRVERAPSRKAELAELRSVAKRSLADARLKGLSIDGKYGHAYDAARALATMVVRAVGYRVRTHRGAHFNTFLALEAADPVQFGRYAVYLNVCRDKRNDLSYEMAGIVSETEAEELLRETSALELLVEHWIRERHSDLP